MDELQVAKHLLPREALLNANDRLGFHERARKTAALVEVGKLAFARRLQIVSQRTNVSITYCFPAKDRSGRSAANQRRDGANYQPTSKALIDGLTIGRIWPDDNKLWVEDGGSHIGGPSPHPLQVEVWISLTPVEPWSETIRAQPKGPAAEILCMTRHRPTEIGFDVFCHLKPHGAEIQHAAITTGQLWRW